MTQILYAHINKFKKKWKLRWEDFKFKTDLGFITRPYLKTATTNSCFIYTLPLSTKYLSQLMKYDIIE
jgi:hypothetical protein